MNDADCLATYCAASDNLSLGLKVLADSVNPLALTRNALVNVASKAGCQAIEIEVACSDKAEYQKRVEGCLAGLENFKLPPGQRF